MSKSSQDLQYSYVKIAKEHKLSGLEPEDLGWHLLKFKEKSSYDLFCFYLRNTKFLGDDTGRTLYDYYTEAYESYYCYAVQENLVDDSKRTVLITAFSEDYSFNVIGKFLLEAGYPVPDRFKRTIEERTCSSADIYYDPVFKQIVQVGSGGKKYLQTAYGRGVGTVLKDEGIEKIASISPEVINALQKRTIPSSSAVVPTPPPEEKEKIMPKSEFDGNSFALLSPQVELKKAIKYLKTALSSYQGDWKTLQKKKDTDGKDKILEIGVGRTTGKPSFIWGDIQIQLTEGSLVVTRKTTTGKEIVHTPITGEEANQQIIKIAAVCQQCEQLKELLSKSETCLIM